MVTSAPFDDSGYLDEQRRANRKALYLYAAECAAKNPNWVGEMVNSDQAIERFGVTGQQLNVWRRNKQIVYFGVSRKRRRFPAEHFCNGGTIIPGIDRLVSIIGTQGETWSFLTQQSASLNGLRPIDVLREGEIERVVATAERNYDVENWQ
jgi:hypothetical protein